MQSLFPTAAANGEKTLVQFPAGKCNLVLQENGKYLVTADDRIGTISLTHGGDGVVHFKWTQNNSSTPEDDRMVFAGENVFKKVKTGRENDRVFMLQYLTGNQRLMYWMQEKSAEHDEDRLKKVNDFIANPRGGEAPAPGAVGSEQRMGANEWMQMLGLPPPAAGATAGLAGAPANAAPPAAPAVPRPNTSGFNTLDLSSLLRVPPVASAAPSATAAPAAAAAPSSGQAPVTLADLQRAMFSGAGTTTASSRAAAAPATRATPALQDIFHGEEILNSGVLNNSSVVADLVAELPPGQQSAAQLDATLRSAQFQQALGSLTHAVQHPDNYQSVMSNFNISPAAGMNQLIAGDGVGAFLTALQADVDASGGAAPAAAPAAPADSSEGSGEAKMDEDSEENKQD